jgi:hypothetical protein
MLHRGGNLKDVHHTPAYLHECLVPFNIMDHLVRVPLMTPNSVEGMFASLELRKTIYSPVVQVRTSGTQG